MRRQPLPWVIFCAAIAVIALLLRPAETPDRPSPRGIVLVTLDTVRADHLSAYGYARQTSPFLERLAGRGSLFAQAYAQAPNTPVSHASIFTGLNPYRHGLRRMHGGSASDLT